MNSRTVRVSGIVSARHAHRVEQALNAVPNVTATVDFKSGNALICMEPQVKSTALQAAAAEAGCRLTDIE